MLRMFVGTSLDSSCHVPSDRTMRRLIGFALPVMPKVFTRSIVGIFLQIGRKETRTREIGKEGLASGRLVVAAPQREDS